MSSLALARAPLQRPARMSQTVETAGPDQDALLLGRALQVLRKRASLSQEMAGQRIEITGQAWAKYENGKAPGIHSPTIQRRLTRALGFEPADLDRERQVLAGGGRTASVTELRSWQGSNGAETMLIRDRVKAGAWLMADDVGQVQPRRHAFARDPRFPHAQQWLSEVHGDSVDRLGIFDGDLVHCIDFESSGLGLHTGQIVEVERLRFGGAERELSIKQVEMTPAGPLLWPRSSNPAWQTPLSMTEGAENEDLEVRVRAVVVHSIRRF